MKIQGFQKTGLALVAAGIVAFSTPNIFGQNTATTPSDTSSANPPLTPAQQQVLQDMTPVNPAPTVTVPSETPTANEAPAAVLTPAMQQVLELSQAKISDPTIIAFVQNSGQVYGFQASQIVYMKQQGVSESVINAMLNQRSVMAAEAAAQAQAQPQMPPPQNYGQYAQPTVAQPTTPAPSTTYIVPDSQTADYNNWASQYSSYPYYPSYYYPYYYPYYNWYWPVWYWGWGWGGHGYYGGYHGYYGGYHSGYYGGYHSGGGYHGWGGGGGYHMGGGGGGGFHMGGGGGGGGFHH